MNDLILHKAAKRIWNKRSKIKAWSIASLIETLPSINRKTAIQIFKILVDRGLMQHSFSIDDNGQKDWFKISFNNEKEWKNLASIKRIFDPYISISKHFFAVHLKPLVSKYLFVIIPGVIVGAIIVFVFQPLQQNTRENTQQKPQEGQEPQQGKHPISIPESASSKEIELLEPTFSEKTETVNFSMGERGFTVGYNYSSLERKAMDPFNFAGFSPVRLYIEDNNPYADVTIYGGSGLPPIEIKHNQLSNKPHDWDFNSNENALEVVNEKKIPVYQFYYKTPSHIVVNGIFPYPGGLILANQSGAMLNPILPTSFKLERIFKYPSWKYPGQYEGKK